MGQKERPGKPGLLPLLVLFLIACRLRPFRPLATAIQPAGEDSANQGISGHVPIACLLLQVAKGARVADQGNGARFWGGAAHDLMSHRHGIEALASFPLMASFVGPSNVVMAPIISVSV